MPPQQQRTPERPAVDPKQAALDKEAERLDTKAEDAQDKAAALAADAQKAEERAEDFGEGRVVRCPDTDCRERLEKYTGSNEHKIGTYFCPNHGRIRLARGRIAS